MAIGDYLDKCGAKPEEKLREFWNRTELTGDDFAEMDFSCTDADEYKEHVFELTGRIMEDDPGLKTFCQQRADEFFKLEGGEAAASMLEAICAMQCGDDAKRERLAAVTMRAIRGEYSESAEHRVFTEASGILAQGRHVNAWEKKIDALKGMN